MSISIKKSNTYQNLTIGVSNLQVPGRMGLLITLYLISSNLYSSLKIPQQRGFSYIETWLLGIQVPILVRLKLIMQNQI